MAEGKSKARACSATARDRTCSAYVQCGNTDGPIYHAVTHTRAQAAPPRSRKYLCGCGLKEYSSAVTVSYDTFSKLWAAIAFTEGKQRYSRYPNSRPRFNAIFSHTYACDNAGAHFSDWTRFPGIGGQRRSTQV